MFNQRMPGGPPGREIALFSSGGYLGYTPPDVTTLITGLGGNAAVTGFYDVRNGFTFNAANGNLSSWADARGGGFGPALVQATAAKQPRVDGNGSIVTNGSASQNLLSSAFYAINAACMLVFVGSQQVPSSGTGYACAIGNASTAFLGVMQNGAGNNWGAKGGGVVVQTTITLSTLPSAFRVAFAGINGTTPLNIHVPNVTGASVAIGTVNAAGSFALCVGAFNGSGGFSNSTIRAVICMPSYFSANTATEKLIRDWAIQYHGVQAA